MRTKAADSDKSGTGNDSYNNTVKKRLSSWLCQLRAQGFDLDFSMLASRMLLDYNINTTDQKLRAMFAEGDRKIQLAEMVALCHMLRIPLQDMCEFPNAPSDCFDLFSAPWVKNFRTKQTTENTQGIVPLSNEYYCGRFYCYYFYPKHYTNSLNGTPVDQMKIEAAEIMVENKDGSAFVTMEEKSGLVNFYGDQVLDEIKLQGRLYLTERTHQAYCFLTDHLGKRTVFLMFDYHEYSKDIMYYRTAAMLTVSRNERCAPMFQKMAMLRVEQDLSDPKVDTILRGILSLNTGNLFIQKAVFDQLKQQNPALDKINCEPVSYYVLSESDLLRPSSEDQLTFEDRQYRLMQLRRASEYQAHEVVLEREEHAPYMKKLQQTQIRASAASSAPGK